MRVIAIFVGLQASALDVGGNKMRCSHNTGMSAITLCLSVLMATSAFADDCSSPTGYISNPSCPPGSVAYQAAAIQPGTLAYQAAASQPGTPAYQAAELQPGTLAYQAAASQPGTLAYQAAELQPDTLAYQMKQQRECSNPNGYLFNFSCPLGSAAYQEQQRVAAAAADPRNRNDPNSPYYAGTPVQQCEAAKHSLFCGLGIACPPPPGIDCARIGATRAAARHYHPY